MNKNKPVILFLCGYQAVYGGNFIPSLMALEEGFQQQGGQCVYVFPAEAMQRVWFAQLQQMGKTVDVFPFNASRLTQIKHLTDLVQKYHITIIHSHFAPIIPLEIFAFLNKNVQVLIHLHSDFSSGKQSLKIKLKNLLIYKILSARVRFISVSKAFVNYNPAKIYWIPNALAIKRMPCEHILGEQIRKKYGVDKRDILCEIFGWSPKVKGVDIAVEAIKQLHTQNPSYKLAIICGREMTVEKMPIWVASHTSCSGREDFLLYLPPTEDVFGYHEAADMLLSASRSEGFPYSILEMLSLGKPCVMSDIPGVSWAKKYPLSYVFASENISACKQAVIQAITGKNKMFLSQTADQIRTDYNIHTWVNRVLNTYEN